MIAVLRLPAEGVSLVLATEKLLEVRNLQTYFYTEQGISKAVDGVNLEIYPRETLGVVGESGCGKSVTALSIMRLIQTPPGRIVGGEILLNGQDLLRLDSDAMRQVRGKDIAMIFQEPMVSLSPVYTVGQQIMEAILVHRSIGKKEALARAVQMLQQVGIPSPEQRVNEYPHQLSGGMRQRVMIAMALSCNPQLLIADEPTTALDVTIQAQILELLMSLRDTLNMAIMMITHDLGVIAEVADRVAIMYAGQVVEYAEVTRLFDCPAHPYTRGLMNSVPQLDLEVERLKTISGVVPSSFDYPPGCRYSTRCPQGDARCRSEEPQLRVISEGHQVRCWNDLR